MKTAEVNELRESEDAWPAMLGRRLAGLWLAVRSGRTAKRIRVLETVHLGEKRQLVLVAFGTRQLLIGAAANFLATLAELDLKREEMTNE